MFDCIKYKDFFADKINDNKLLKKELSLNEVLKRPFGMSDEAFENYKKIDQKDTKKRREYLTDYRKIHIQCVQCGKPAAVKNDGEPYKLCKEHLKKYTDQDRQTAREIKEDQVEYIEKKYKYFGCKTCGYRETFAALDFHHRDKNSKSKNWNILRRTSPGTDEMPNEPVRSELDKCELLCKNHHAIVELQSQTDYSKDYQAKKLACLMYKKTLKCTNCNYSGDQRALAFHHFKSVKDPYFKNFYRWREWKNWSSLSGNGATNTTSATDQTPELPERIKEELDVCKVLCCNCHAVVHFNTITGEVNTELTKETPEQECTDDICRKSH